jgi:hypothetical protein
MTEGSQSLCLLILVPFLPFVLDFLFFPLSFVLEMDLFIYLVYKIKTSVNTALKYTCMALVDNLFVFTFCCDLIL